MTPDEKKIRHPEDIRRNVATVGFQNAASRFCELLEQPPTDDEEWCVAITAALSRLYAAGHDLPVVDFDRIEVPKTFDVDDTQWKAIYTFVGNILRDQTGYWAYFDPSEPLEPRNQNAIFGDLADDLADIYRDVKPGVRA